MQQVKMLLEETDLLAFIQTEDSIKREIVE